MNSINDEGSAAVASVLARTQLVSVYPRDIRHPSLHWRALVRSAGAWDEASHAAYPASLRRSIVCVLVIARSDMVRMRARAHGLTRLDTHTLYALFRSIARLEYFEV